MKRINQLIKESLRDSFTVIGNPVYDTINNL